MSSGKRFRKHSGKKGATQRSTGVSAKKHLGQHFLTDPSVAERIAETLPAQGLARVLEYLADGGDYTELLVGKISMSQIEVIRELRWRRILESPRLRPRYLDRPSCRERLQRAREGLSITDLLDG